MAQQIYIYLIESFGYMNEHRCIIKWYTNAIPTWAYVLFHHKAYYYEQPNLIVSDIQHTEDFDALGTSWQTGKDL